MLPAAECGGDRQTYTAIPNTSFKPISGSAHSSNRIRTYFNITLGMCQALCSAHTDCILFEFTPGGVYPSDRIDMNHGDCVLKRHLGVSLNRNAKGTTAYLGKCHLHLDCDLTGMHEL